MQPIPEDASIAAGFGECRRNAPVAPTRPYAIYQHPVRDLAEEWCGEHPDFQAKPAVCLHLHTERRGDSWVCTSCGVNMDAAASRGEPAEASDV